MKKITVLFLLIISTTVMAQKMKLLSGDFKNLKGITEYNLVFDYTNLKVDKFDTEEAFLADKMKKREEKGTDDDFKKSWFSDRQERYEPKFIESFNKRFEGTIKADKNLNSAKYTATVKTIWIYPGYNVGVMRSPAKITTTITVSENMNPNNVLAVIQYEKAEGNGAMGYDFNSGYRISEAYAKLAKEFAAHLKKKSS
jgi:hypothetical protein